MADFAADLGLGVTIGESSLPAEAVRTGLLIIRVSKSDPPRRFERTFASPPSVPSGFERRMTLSQVPALCEAVETWLGNMVAGSGASSM